MESEVREMHAQLEALKQSVAGLPSAEDEAQQKALDGLNELVRILERMGETTEAFVRRHNIADEQEK